MQYVTERHSDRHFLPRDAMLAPHMLRLCVCICLSVCVRHRPTNVLLYHYANNA